MTNITVHKTFMPFDVFTAYDHARIVFTLNFGENLLTFQAVKDMCTIEQRLEDLGPYKVACDEKDHKCCPAWSLVNYITLLRNHKSCTEIQVIFIIIFEHESFIKRHLFLF